MKRFIGTCVGLPADKLEAFDDSAKEIGYKTFLRHVGRETVKDLDKACGVPLRKDWHVSFERGKWEGKPAVCMHHSGIHHLWAI